MAGAAASPPPHQTPACRGLITFELPEAGKPAAGRGRDREGACTKIGAVHPLPNPPPQAGEGAHRARGASKIRTAALATLHLTRNKATDGSFVEDAYYTQSLVSCAAGSARPVGNS